jgi:hypothetical protein
VLLIAESLLEFKAKIKKSFCFGSGAWDGVAHKKKPLSHKLHQALALVSQIRTSLLWIQFFHYEDKLGGKIGYFLD